MLDLALTIFYLFIIVNLGYGVFFVGQLVIERFVKQTIPTVALVIDQIRHPEKYDG